MRKILCTLALVLEGVALYAQSTDSLTEKPYIEVLDSIFQYLNKGLITTGVLYDRVFPWAELAQGVISEGIDFEYAEQA